MVLNITTFGGLFIADDDGNSISEKELRSPMIEKLFLYMLFHRQGSMTSDEIIEAVWQGEESENPLGTLKNLTYRLRKELAKKFGNTEFIITEQRGYHWNPEVIVYIDVDEFETLIKQAKYEADQKKARKLYEQALKICKGEFMPKISDLYWISSQNTYYHSLYISAAKSLCKLYTNAGEYERLEELCELAIKYNNTDEQLYCYQIEARMHMGKVGLAMDTYERARIILDQEIGVQKSTLLSKVHDELLNYDKRRSEENFLDIRSDIIEDGEPEGVFMCAYPIFREIYQLEARKATRLPERSWLVLFTIKNKLGENGERQQRNVSHAMADLEEIIRRYLRIGDVCAKYSDTQFVVLLSRVNAPIANDVANRIVNKLLEYDDNYARLEMSYSTEEVTFEGKVINEK